MHRLVKRACHNCQKLTLNPAQDYILESNEQAQHGARLLIRHKWGGSSFKKCPIEGGGGGGQGKLSSVPFSCFPKTAPPPQQSETHVVICTVPVMQ